MHFVSVYVWKNGGVLYNDGNMHLHRHVQSQPTLLVLRVFVAFHLCVFALGTLHELL